MPQNFIPSLALQQALDFKRVQDGVESQSLCQFETPDSQLRKKNY
jgi:hypothetical protein